MPKTLEKIERIQDKKFRRRTWIPLKRQLSVRERNNNKIVVLLSLNCFAQKQAGNTKVAQFISNLVSLVDGENRAEMAGQKT